MAAPCVLRCLLWPGRTTRPRGWSESRKTDLCTYKFGYNLLKELLGRGVHSTGELRLELYEFIQHPGRVVLRCTGIHTAVWSL